MLAIKYNGREYRVISEDSRFYYCPNTQFKKSNPGIEVIVKEEKKKTAPPTQKNNVVPENKRGEGVKE